MNYWNRFASQRTGFIRWVTRGTLFRYCIVQPSPGAGLIWEHVEVHRGVFDSSTGAFYDNMDPCPPTWRRHHPDARVETVRAIRYRCSTMRALHAVMRVA